MSEWPYPVRLLVRTLATFAGLGAVLVAIFGLAVLAVRSGPWGITAFLATVLGVASCLIARLYEGGTDE